MDLVQQDYTIVQILAEFGLQLLRLLDSHILFTTFGILFQQR